MRYACLILLRSFHFAQQFYQVEPSTGSDLHETQLARTAYVIMMKFNYKRPFVVAGVCGILMVAALFGLPAVLGNAGWPGAAGFPALLLPGVLAAALTERGTGFAPLREGALAGLLTGCGAAALDVWAFVVGVAEIDWASYSAQVGQQVAAEVRGAIVPLSVIGTALALVVCLAGCTLLGWLGAVGYGFLRDLSRSSRERVPSRSGEG